jgi:hypothetical protein
MVQMQVLGLKQAHEKRNKDTVPTTFLVTVYD